MKRNNVNKLLRHEQSRVEPFHFHTSTALVAGATSVNVAPASFPRMAIVADSFALYRVTELEYRLLPAGTITGNQAAGYIPGAVDTPPSTVIQLSETLESVILPIRQTVPTNWAKLQWADLKSYLPWYKSVIGTTDPVDEIQGTIFFCGSGTETVSYEVRGIFEFKNPISASNTPMLREQKILKEKARLYELLTFTPQLAKVQQSLATAKREDEQSRSVVGNRDIASRLLGLNGGPAC